MPSRWWDISLLFEGTAEEAEAFLDRVCDFSYADPMVPGVGMKDVTEEIEALG